MNAIGLIETIGFVAAIEASDACVKSANVNIVSLDKVGAGIVTLTICGDVGAVKSAVEAGELAASRIGTLRSSHVIPRMQSEVADVLFKKEEPKVDEKDNNLNENSLQENLSMSTEVVNEALDDDSTKIIENEIEDSNTDNEEVLETLDIENETKSTNIDKDDLSKHSVKELKGLVKKLDSSISNKELNMLKKEELINLLKSLSGEDR